jgi:uncharacterized protein YktB (UPF0637 family)
MKTETKSISFMSIRVNVPNELKHLITHTMAMSSIKKLHNNLAEEFKKYITETIVPIYNDKNLTKSEALELVARAVGLEKSDLEGATVAIKKQKTYDHPSSFQKEIEVRLTEMFPPKKHKG